MKCALHSMPALASTIMDVRAYTRRLVASLSAEDAAIQSMPDASPAKWHLAHTTWFFEAAALSHVPGYEPFDRRFKYLFNSNFGNLCPRHPRPMRGVITRPSLEEVIAWRAYVDDALVTASRDESLHAVILLGLHHEQQHQEFILTDIKHAFFCNPLLPSYCKQPVMTRAQRPRGSMSFAGGISLIGHDGEGFAFDNETPRHEVKLRPFRIATHPVTNGEYQSFIRDGGYHRAELWLSDGWARVQQEGWRAPLYWANGDDGCRDFAFTLAGPQPLDPHAPVEHVSFFEAAAYAAWAGARLPTEFEWEAASPFLEYGEVWEWTRSSYAPYPGFPTFERVAAGYDGKFSIGQMVLRGGSVATPPRHMRPTYRNFFPPQARWQFSGIRLAEDI